MIQIILCDDNDVFLEKFRVEIYAPCLINLSTGEKRELDVYEPHPFLVGEIAEEQRAGYFCFVRGAGAEGYKLGAKSITITIPVKSDKMNKRYFCNDCREMLEDYTKCGYVLADLKVTDSPVIYEITTKIHHSL